MCNKVETSKRRLMLGKMAELSLRREKDDLTMAVFGELANAIDPNI